MNNKQLELMFNSNETVCFGQTAFDTKSSTLDAYTQHTQYVTLNPIRERRADANVITFRNILIELDKGSLEQQVYFIKRNRIPYSVITYSGSKSLHCIISLEEPIGTEEEYRQLVTDIYYLVDPNKIHIDHTCKNPSRFTRLAGSIRSGTNIEQSLIDATERIGAHKLFLWMTQHKNYRMMLKDKSNKAQITTPPPPPSSDGGLRGMSRRAEAFFTYGVLEGQSWRTEAYYACSEAARCGFTLEEVTAMLEAVDGYLNSDSRTIPRDAFKSIGGKYGA